jgi:hypothetical protein
MHGSKGKPPKQKNFMSYKQFMTKLTKFPTRERGNTASIVTSRLHHQQETRKTATSAQKTRGKHFHIGQRNNRLVFMNHQNM